MTEAQRIFDEAISETQFTTNVIRLAHLCGCLACHFRPAWTEKGWRTPLQGDPGLPDTIIVKEHGDEATLIIWELKKQIAADPKGKQAEWLRMLGKVTRIIVGVKRPSDWPEIEEALR